MSPQLVFLSLFLGLVSGPVDVDLQAGPGIESVRILLDGRQIAAMQKAPWHATVDLGPAIAPGELVAVGYDEHGNEVARVAQTVNLPRPTAELVIALQNGADGTPLSVTLRWEHLLAAKPVKSSLSVDGKSVPLDLTASARLPRLDMSHPHVIAAEMTFDDGIRTRRELIVGGEVGYTSDTQLTPIGVRQSSAVPPANTGDCLTSTGSPVRVAAIEKSPALVIFVLDPLPRDIANILDPSNSQGFSDQLRRLITLDSGTSMRILWPVAQRFKTTSNSDALLFPPSPDIEASGQTGLIWLLTRAYNAPLDEHAPRQAADAVGVAGLNAITVAQRRAVVLVLSHYKDVSIHSSASVRNYLGAIGVPLFVWSMAGPRPDLQGQWGEVEDISSPVKLKTAADRLRAELASQRVAWLAADPLTALRAQPTGRCGIVPLAVR